MMADNTSKYYVANQYSDQSFQQLRVWWRNGRDPLVDASVMLLRLEMLGTHSWRWKSVCVVTSWSVPCMAASWWKFSTIFSNYMTYFPLDSGADVVTTCTGNSWSIQCVWLLYRGTGICTGRMRQPQELTAGVARWDRIICVMVEEGKPSSVKSLLLTDITGLVQKPSRGSTEMA